MKKSQIPFFSCDHCNPNDIPNKCLFDFKPNLKIGLRRHYKLKCINCSGSNFFCPGDVFREGKDRKPICMQCLADISQSEQEQFQEDQWYKNHPGQDPEEVQREQVYLQRYGEY